MRQQLASVALLVALTACGGGGGNQAASDPAASPAAVLQVQALPSAIESAATTSSLAAKAVDLTDAIAILKMIVGLDVNTGAAPLTAYQAYAADVDGNGKVELSDAISVLKRIVGLETATANWMFFNGTPTVADKINPGLPPSVSAAVSGSSNVQMTAMLRGDVVNSGAYTYSWSLTSKPTGSSASLSSATATRPSITADVAGTYVMSLTIKDGSSNLETSTVTVTACNSGSSTSNPFSSCSNNSNAGTNNNGTNLPENQSVFAGIWQQTSSSIESCIGIGCGNVYAPGQITTTSTFIIFPGNIFYILTAENFYPTFLGTGEGVKSTNSFSGVMTSFTPKNTPSQIMSPSNGNLNIKIGVNNSTAVGSGLNASLPSEFDMTLSPNMTDYEGNWYGGFLGHNKGNIQISKSGEVSGSFNEIIYGKLVIYCKFSGTVVKSGFGINMLDVNITYGELPCNYPGMNLSGFAFIYKTYATIGGPGTPNLMIGLRNSDKSYGTLFKSTERK